MDNKPELLLGILMSWISAIFSELVIMTYALKFSPAVGILMVRYSILKNGLLGLVLADIITLQVNLI